jgi:hypothetical protein
MVSSENAVREAAAKLHKAITTAESEGYRITWPPSAAGLVGIAISETAKVKQSTDVAKTPAVKPVT